MNNARIALTLVEFDDAGVLDRNEKHKSQSSLSNGEVSEDRERSYSHYELRVLKSLERLSVPPALVQKAKDRAASVERSSAPGRSVENLLTSASRSPSSSSNVVVRTQPTYRSLTNLHNHSATMSLAPERDSKPVHVELPSAKFRQRNEKLAPIQSSMPKSFDEFKKSLPNLAFRAESDAVTAPKGDSLDAQVPLLRLTGEDFQLRCKKAPAQPLLAADSQRKRTDQDELVRKLAAFEVEKASMCAAPPLPSPTPADPPSRPTADCVCSFVRRKVYELNRLATQGDSHAVAVRDAVQRFSPDTQTCELVYSALDSPLPLRYVTARDDAFYPRCEAFLAKFTANINALRVASRAARAGATLLGNGVLLFVFPRLADMDAYLSAEHVDVPTLKAFVSYASVRDVRQQLVPCAGVGVRTLADLAALYDSASHFVLACALFSGEDTVRRDSKHEQEVDAVCKWQCVELAQPAPRVQLQLPLLNTTDLRNNPEDELRRRARETRCMRIERALQAYDVHLRQLQPQLHADLLDYVQTGRTFQDVQFSFNSSASGETVTYSCVVSVLSDDLEPLITRVSGGTPARPFTWWNTTSPVTDCSANQRASVPTPSVSVNGNGTPKKPPSRTTKV